MEKAKMLIWLPRDLHTKLKILSAKTEGKKTMNDMIIEAVEKYINNKI
jgi:predicted DNA-binding protein